MHGHTRLNRRTLMAAVRRITVAFVVSIGLLLGAAGVAQAAEPQTKWDKLAACESGGRWDISTGNGYYGGLQFSKATWTDFGGEGMPHKASKARQIAVAERVLIKQGWNAWPACSKKLGFKGKSKAKAKDYHKSKKGKKGAKGKGKRAHKH